MKTSVKLLLTAALALIAVGLYSVPASAGFMDKINAAAQKLNAKTQNTGSGSVQPAAEEDPDHPLHLDDHYKGSCYGKHSATCMDYGEVVDQCMAPLNGYRAKLLADRIDKKLKTEKLNDKQRKNLQEDMAGLREAEQNKTNDPTIAGEKNSQRYLMDISEEDQVCVNAEYGAFHQKIYNKCMGADHMNTGHRTEMAQEPTMTCEEAIAQYREEHKRKDEPMNCLKSISGIRYLVMADMMDKKMQNLKLSDKERAEWQADIAAVRAAANAETPTMPQVDDPKNPYRPLSRLSAPDEQMALNTEYSKQSQEAIAKCSANSANPRSANQAAKLEKKGLVDHSTSPSNKNAKKQDRKDIQVQTSIIGANNLMAMKGYTGCYAPLKGHLAKVTADALEAKLKSSKGVSDQERKEWQEDIAAWRAAEAAGADSPNPPDPDNPYRWYDYVTNQERANINKQHLDFNNQIVKQCDGRASGL